MPSEYMQHNHHLSHILLADDDEDDCDFFQEVIALLKPRYPIELTMVTDGVELMNKLTFHGTELPDLLLLDLNMPRKNGLQCLREIRSNKNLHHIIVAVFTTSTSPADIEESYRSGANIYINKPSRFSDLTSLVEDIVTINWETYKPKSSRLKFVWENQ